MALSSICPLSYPLSHPSAPSWQLQLMACFPALSSVGPGQLCVWSIPRAAPEGDGSTLQNHRPAPRPRPGEVTTGKESKSKTLSKGWISSLRGRGRSREQEAGEVDARKHPNQKSPWLGRRDRTAGGHWPCTHSTWVRSPKPIGPDS